MIGTARVSRARGMEPVRKSCWRWLGMRSSGRFAGKAGDLQGVDYSIAVSVPLFRRHSGVCNGTAAGGSGQSERLRHSRINIVTQGYAQLPAE
ncbi:hypothetical protein NBRC116187_24070 [Halopseudomonas sabulinigri]|uniref:Uncharacterized protein n=1 Tax=Halopseudomonas sabulinigri TaxID=472181 RepID=A0ABP9ZRF8_9GAMM